jgi:molybdopterin-guanine dinucleotide biosynthesis protein A
MTVGIVLAGGRSSRFGRDKLAEPIAGEPLLWRPIRALAAAGCTEIVVVIGPAGPEPGLPPDVTSVGFARDPEPFGGPLVGLRAGLAAIVPPGSATAASTGAVATLVVAGDQPTLEPAVLVLLGERIATGAGAAILVDADGHARPLPMALDARSGLEASDRLLASGHRRLRDLLDDLGADVIDRAAWSSLDPTGATLADIDEPGDLVDPGPD